MCAQACPCSLLQGQGRRLNSLLSWGKSGDLVYSQDHSPEHSASSTGADRRGISGQIREGPARQRLAGHGVVPVQRPGHWPGKVRGQPGTGSDAGLPPVQLSVAGPPPGKVPGLPSTGSDAGLPAPSAARPAPGSGVAQGAGRKTGAPSPAGSGPAVGARRADTREGASQAGGGSPSKPRQRPSKPSGNWIWAQILHGWSSVASPLGE